MGRGVTLLGAVPSPDRPSPMWLACSHSTPQRPPLQILAFSHQSSSGCSSSAGPAGLCRFQRGVWLPCLFLSLLTLHTSVHHHTALCTLTPSPHACAYSTPTQITHTHLHMHTQNHRLTPAWAHHTMHSHTLMTQLTQAPCDPCMMPV